MKQKTKGFYPKIRSRHPSHQILRENPKLKSVCRSVIRLGSTTTLQDDKTSGGTRIEINTVASVRNSASKLLMKKCFTRDQVKTADWFTTNGQTWIKKNGEDTIMNLPDLPFPLVAKHIYGSRGTGNTLLNSQEELTKWMVGKTLSNYIFEKFYNYSKEYRLHVTKDGCFYTCRKMLKQGTPEEDKWHRHDSNSVWILEDNQQFEKPENWNKIIEHSVKALKAVGLDIGAVDVKVQSSKTAKGKVREEIDFIIIEINSAPSFGEITAQKYIEMIPKLIYDKYMS